VSDKRAYLSAKDLGMILDVLEQHIDSLKTYCLPRREEILLHDRVVAEYNYMIRPIKPRKKKEKVNENKLVD